MKIAICDDEPMYIYDVKRHLVQYFMEHGFELDMYEFLNGDDLLNCTEVFNIVFLDVEINGTNGIDVGKKLISNNPDIVLIYITAYNHYLDDALDLGSTRFFTKPINSQRFYAGLDKAIEKADALNAKLYIKDENNIHITIRVQDIILVEINGRKTHIITCRSEFYSKDSIHVWREKLSQSFFQIPHNSYIVNVNYITKYSRERIVLVDKYTVPITYKNRAEFRRRLNMIMAE